MRKVYERLVREKKAFIARFAEEFITQGIPQCVENFARELLLEASECENAFYMLPPLQRDSFSKKGIFYRTEKIITVNYSTSFPFASSSKMRE